MSRKRYSVEFKSGAVQLMVLDGLSAAKVSEKLGVSANQLYKWKHAHLAELEVDAQANNQRSPIEMAAEIDQLRKELARSERINEILKKTVGYFAKDEK